MKNHDGVRRVAFKDDEILGAMVRAWADAINEAEDDYFAGDDDIYWMLEQIVGPEVASTFLHDLSVQVLRVEPSLYPEYRFAIVEVTGEWIDYEGESHRFLSELEQVRTPSGMGAR